MDIPAMRVSLSDGSYIDRSTAAPLYLKLYGNLYKSPSGVSKPIHIGCHVLYHVLPPLTSDIVLSTDWLHAIKPWIDWNAYSLSLDYIGETVHTLGIKSNCFPANVDVCTLKLVLKKMFCDKVMA